MNLELNCGPLSEMIFCGRPNRFHTSAAYCNFQQDNWSSLLPFAEFAHNIRHHSAINESPFKALMGYHPRFTDIQPHGINNPTVEERIKLLERMREEINASSRIAAEMVRNRAGTSIPAFKKGDEVWLEGRNITTTHPSVKLAPKRHRPFTIEDMLGPVTAKLRLPHQWKIHPVFHTSLLTPFKSTPEHGAPFPKPPP